jgi:hypothetical protein
VRPSPTSQRAQSETKTAFRGYFQNPCKVRNLPGLPEDVDAHGKRSEGPCRAPSPRFPQPTTTSWKTADVFLSPLENSAHPSDGWPDFPTAPSPTVTTMIYHLFTKGGRTPDSHGLPDLKVATSINCEPLSSLRSDSGHIRRNRWSPSSEYASRTKTAADRSSSVVATDPRGGGRPEAQRRIPTARVVRQLPFQSYRALLVRRWVVLGAGQAP